MLFSVFEGNDPKSGRERGQIQIRRVFDVIAQAKVLKQDENNPLLPGMIIANPAFQRGRKLTFVLSGAFRERKIKEFLARYPCGIAGKVTRETDYVVAGEGGKAGDSPPEVAEAKRLGITVMTESQLLRYLGEAE
jgi:NAD-dependent DNA ligase